MRTTLVGRERQQRATADDDDDDAASTAYFEMTERPGAPGRPGAHFERSATAVERQAAERLEAPGQPGAHFERPRTAVERQAAERHGEPVVWTGAREGPEKIVQRPATSIEPTGSSKRSGAQVWSTQRVDGGFRAARQNCPAVGGTRRAANGT